jgi:hypothetical protein
MEGEIIISSIIFLIGLTLMQMVYNNNWFRRENFKIKRDTVKAENRIKLKKLEREMGLGKTKSAINDSDTQKSGGISELLPLLSNLPPDVLGELAEKFLGESSAGGTGLDEILGNIPPELISKFLQGINAGSKDNTNKEKEDIVWET